MGVLGRCSLVLVLGATLLAPAALAKDFQSAKGFRLTLPDTWVLVTPETVAEAIEKDLMALMPDNVQVIRIRLGTEQITGTWYQYSHGLKHHCGNCQRIAHGHRSRIEISRNGARDPELEKAWAERWRDTYIGSREDLAGETTHAGTPYLHFAYSSSQGAFELELPKRACQLIDTDSTVENIAGHIAASLKQEYPDDTFEVRAFEGVGKGAIAVT